MFWIEKFCGYKWFLFTKNSKVWYINNINKKEKDALRSSNMYCCDILLLTHDMAGMIPSISYAQIFSPHETVCAI